MKRRFLIYAVLICLALVGCGNNEDSEETETKTEAQPINASVIVKYSEKEIVVFSETSCFFNLEVSVDDGEFSSKDIYGEFQISEGETITLTLEDLAPGFFSDKAIINSVSNNYPFVYEKDSPLSIYKYEYIDDALILLKYSSEECIIYSDTTCFFDLSVYTVDNEFKSDNIYKKLNISEGETITLTLEDLAPGFFSDTATITYSCIYVMPYIQK